MSSRCRRGFQIGIAFLLGMQIVVCLGSDRITMTGPRAGQEAATQLMASLASSCNSKDFLGFMDHFTPRQQAAIKRRMEDVFTTHDPEMTVDDIVLLADGEDRIVFGVRYGWGTKAGARRTMASRVTAKKVGGRWKVDSEQVKSQAPAKQSLYHQDAQPVRFEFGGGGAVNANWDAFNPPAHLIDPAIEHLRGDIGIQPGRGCVGGRCGLR